MSFAVKHGSKHRDTQLAVSEPSSLPLYEIASSHVRVGKISDVAHVSFQEPSTSNHAATGQLTSSKVQLNTSFYSSSARALKDLPSPDQEDKESIPDTEVWGLPCSMEYAEEVEDE